MIRILGLVEGQTEETFVREVLAPDLRHRSRHMSAFLVGKPGKKGGIRRYSVIKRELLRILKMDQGAIVTTMFDYYALPHDFPGRTTAASEKSAERKAAHVEEAMLADLEREMGAGWDASRFLPYIQIHEFEAVLFSDPERLASGLYQPALAEEFAAIRAAFQDPEHIDEGAETAPGKRIKTLFPGYDKPLHGCLAAIEIGLVTMLQHCPHFAAWVDRLRGSA